MRRKRRHKRRYLRIKGSRLAVAFACSLFIIFADYLLSNLSFPLFDESESLSLFAYLDSKNTPDESGEVLCVNTGVDLQLVPVLDDFGDTIGSAPITDRKALLRFLEIAETANPKYIILDIRFEKGFETDADSALFAKIHTLPRFVFANHRQREGDRKSTRLNSSHCRISRMPSSA